MAVTKQGELEAILFSAGDPLTLEQIARALVITAGEAADLLDALQLSCQRPDRGLILRKAAGGWQMVTKPENTACVQRLQNRKELKLSNAALETLAIVAFRQPVTKSEIEAVRGVKADSVLASLLDLRLIEEVGRKDVVGRPILYGTTEQFLTVFGLASLDDLPRIPEDLLEEAAKNPENLFDD